MLSFRACIAAGALVASVTACSAGSSTGAAIPPATPPPSLQSVLTSAQAPATVYLPSVNITIPPVATAGAQPGAALTAASPYVVIPAANPTATLAACGAPATGPQPGVPCPTVIAFAASAAAPAGIPGIVTGLSYITFASNVPVTLAAQPTIGFSLAPFPYNRNLRLFAYNSTTTSWSDTGITPVVNGATISFPGAVTPLVLQPQVTAYALTVS